MAPSANLRTEHLDWLLHTHGYPLLKSSGAVGAACVLVRAGLRGQRQPMVFSRGLGYERADEGKVVDVGKSLFNCGACSKVLCTLGIMQLWQEQGLELHTDVNHMLPEGVEIEAAFPEPITLHHLLTHTSGLATSNVIQADGEADESNSVTMYIRSSTDPTAQKSLVMRRLRGTQVHQVAAPGAQHLQSSVNDEVAGAVLESFTGTEYGRYIHRRLLQPLDLNIAGARIVTVYETDARGNTSPTRPSPRPLLPGGGLVATAEEMAQILLWLVQPVGVGPTPGVLSNSTIQAMLSGRFPIGNTGQTACYGFTSTPVGCTGSPVPLIVDVADTEVGRGCCQSVVAVLPDLQCAIWLSSNTSSEGLGFCLPMLELLIEYISPVDESPEILGQWLSNVTPTRADTVLDLYCFPSAGCSATAQFEGWDERLPDYISVKAVQLPGRSSRASEPSSRSLHDMADKAAKAIRMRLTEGMPIALIGHGMGGIMAYEVACRLKGMYNRAPIHLFVIGCAAPAMWNTNNSALGTENNTYTPWRHALVALRRDPLRATDSKKQLSGGGDLAAVADSPQRTFLKQLDSCSRLPRHLKHLDQAAENQVKVLLADITVEETYTPQYHGFRFPRHSPLARAASPAPAAHPSDDRQSAKLGCPITVIRAKDDPYVPAEFTQRWKEVTSGAVKCHEIVGPHHSLEDAKALVALSEIVGGALTRQLTRHSAFVIPSTTGAKLR